MPRVVHFEIHADDPLRAVDFYSKLFGWNIHKMGEHDYWYVKTGDVPDIGINGGIVRRKHPLVGSGEAAFVCTINVPHIDDYLLRLPELKGSIVVPKAYLPGVGYLAYCADTEGNVFGIMQDEKK